MEYMDMLNDNNPPHSSHESREPSVSHEGSQAFLFQDLLGDYNANNNNNSIKAKEKEASLSKHSDPNGNFNPSNPSNDPIQAIFDDIFDDPLEESERASTIISIFTDDEEDDLESTQEGWDPNNTTFKLPQDNASNHDQDDADDLFASIMNDLDKKKEELEQKESAKSKNHKKKKGKGKGKKKKPKKAKPQPMDPQKPVIDPVAPNPNPNPASDPSPISPVPSVTVIQINDVNASVIPDEIQQELDEWEKDKMGQRKGIRTLLSTLHQILPECAMDKWEVVKLSGLMNDAAVRKYYLRGVRVVHPDKCMQRKYDKVTQMICNQIFQALEQSYANEQNK